MRGVREHVDHARMRAAIAGLVDQQPGIARQRRRVAADVDDALWWRPSGHGCRMQFGQGLGQRERTFARRIDQPLVAPRPAPPGPTAPNANRSRASKRVFAARPLSAALSRARCTSTSLPSMPSTRAARVASGRLKLPRPQNQSITRSSALHVQQAQRARHEHAVDGGIDLREVGRPEAAGARRTPAAHRPARGRRRRGGARCPAPWAAATIAHRACAPKSRSRSRSASLKRLQVAQHQRA